MFIIFIVIGVVGLYDLHVVLKKIESNTTYMEKYTHELLEKTKKIDVLFEMIKKME